jgi:hypothetical protein
MSAYVSNLSVPLLLAYEDVNDAEKAVSRPGTLDRDVEIEKDLLIVIVPHQALDP